MALDALSYDSDTSIDTCCEMTSTMICLSHNNTAMSRVLCYLAREICRKKLSTDSKMTQLVDHPREKPASWCLPYELGGPKLIPD